MDINIQPIRWHTLLVKPKNMRINWSNVVAAMCAIHALDIAGKPAAGYDTARLPLRQMAKDAGSNTKNNPYLDQFLDVHSKPKITWDTSSSGMFDLIMDARYIFKPPIRKAPFMTTGEPWPRPREIKLDRESLVYMNKATFKIIAKGSSDCDILDDAINRYNKIVPKHVIEEHYDFVYNFNNKTIIYRENQLNVKYKNLLAMKDLEVHVSGTECGYPHLGMDESYQLQVNGSGSILKAPQVWGALRGLETFSQLVFKRRRTNKVFARVANIIDKPRFPHRGILMDSSRHYIHNYTILNVLDAMSYNKLNVLHWHIVDDNSFPYQSEVFPKLSQQGAYHPTLVYTLKNIKQLVEYARLRGIRVVPEFDSPGHTFSWLGYPEIRSTCYQSNGAPLDGPLGPINPAQDETYTFMSKLFSEIYEVFPDTYVHLGGDELHSPCWATNPSITKYLETHANLPASTAKSNARSYVEMAIGYYFRRLISTLKETAASQKTTKNFIMWEDVLKNTREIPKDSILQVWFGSNSNVRRLNSAGYKALISSCWYLDNYRQKPMWPTYYTCEPSPYATEAEEAGKLLGGEACLWAEFITTDSLMTMMWPRASVPAERLWSPKDTKDFTSASMRLQEQRCRMISRGLPTGHVSGPDYCLRPYDGPLNGLEPEVKDRETHTEPETERLADDVLMLRRLESVSGSVGPSTDEDQTLSVLVLSQYHHYLPAVNILLSVIGVYGLIVAARYARRKT